MMQWLCACFELLHHKSHGILRARLWVRMMHHAKGEDDEPLRALDSIWSPVPAALALLWKLVLTGCHARRPQSFLHCAVTLSQHTVGSITSLHN